MGRYMIGFILLFIAIGANSQDDAVALADTNTVIKETGICLRCKCTEAKVDCKDRYLGSSFSFEEWNDLTDIKPTKVDLSYNYIHTVTAMAELPIEELDLSNNLIESIDHAAFRDLGYLRVLDLSNNLLTSNLSLFALEFQRQSSEEYSSNMRILNLANNEFHYLDQDFFGNLSELTSLDLSGNPLTTINLGGLTCSLPMLKELSLRYCQLSDIPNMFFYTPRFLERLDLSGNELTTVPQPLEQLQSLTYLNLNHNPIEELYMGEEERTGFPRLPKLRELHMSGMPELTRLGRGALGGLENLAVLDLSYNPMLTDIDPMALAKPDDIGEGVNWPIIKELYLQYNSLSKIDSRLVSRWDLVEKMDLSGNPFLCDCSTQWMLEFQDREVKRTRVNGSETLVCQEPVEMRGYTLQELHDSHRNMPCMVEREADEEMDQHELDRVVVPGPNIVILPWLFLAIPMALAVMMARSRRSSRAYEKLAPPEENYI